MYYFETIGDVYTMVLSDTCPNLMLFMHIYNLPTHREKLFMIPEIWSCQILFEFTKFSYSFPISLLAGPNQNCFLFL